MKLWQVKAMALRIMFSDTAIQFSEEEFKSGVLLTNGNTREKLTRMDDSVRRGIDRYYTSVGEQTLTKVFTLKVENLIYSNEIDVSSEATFGFPTRVDAKHYSSYVDDNGVTVQTFTMLSKQVDFTYDLINKKILFLDVDYTEEGADVTFVIWYKMKKGNIPYVVDQMTYDLDTIYIPEEVQRMLPYFIKGELYEEDNEAMAQTAMGMYINFLRGLRKPFNKVQTKVHRSRVFLKDN